MSPIVFGELENGEARDGVKSLILGEFWPLLDVSLDFFTRATDSSPGTSPIVFSDLKNEGVYYCSLFPYGEILPYWVWYFASASDPELFGFTPSDFNTLLPAADPVIPTHASSSTSASDATLFGFTASDVDTLLPVKPNLLDEFAPLCQSSGIVFTEPDTDFSAATGVSHPLQLLPPAPPESPPAMQLPVAEVSKPGPSAPRSRRGPRNEGIDTANVIHSTRTRAPSSRKRGPDAEISEQPNKRGKSAEDSIWECAVNVPCISGMCVPMIFEGPSVEKQVESDFRQCYLLQL
ncbi:hypothetical protein B0H16DRAFT_1482465 [Mycena metata]|uniref:Uncharacterized protein n=1 Tax=Mycena metata TaxID=1033252 RepID=A0AAD7GTW9_9AGAR|nr:hypothetical protein B0H16DRAFT_1482465 [Mycena metata]